MQDSKTQDPRMAGEEFSRLRKLLGKSQKELAEILGISRKAVESYEQGWRKVPVNTERMLYFLLFKLREPLLAGKGACWETRSCPDSARETCMTWLAKEGHFCWFFTGRLCASRQAEKKILPASSIQATTGSVSTSGKDNGHIAGDTEKSGNDLAFCRACEVFRELIELVKEPSDIVDPQGVTQCP